MLRRTRVLEGIIFSINFSSCVLLFQKVSIHQYHNHKSTERKNDQHTYSYDNKLYMVIKGTMDENETYRNMKLMDNLTEPTKREAEYNHEQGKFVFLSLLI